MQISEFSMQFEAFCASNGFNCGSLKVRKYGERAALIEAYLTEEDKGK